MKQNGMNLFKLDVGCIIYAIIQNAVHQNFEEK